MTNSSTSACLLRGVALVLLALVLLAPLLHYPFARDHGMYVVVAQTMARGGMPYADAWDLKTPGIFFVFRTALGLFGHNMWGVRILELIFLAGTALALSALGRRLFPESAAGPLGAAFFLLFLAHNLNYWHTAQAESFLMLPLVLGIDFALRALNDPATRRGPVHAVLAGIFLGLVFLFKFPNILVVACCLPLLLFPRPPMSAGRRLVLIAWFAAGAVVPVAAAAAWFVRGGAWGQMVEALFVFAPRYAGVTVSGALLLHGLKVFAGFFLPGQGLLLPKWFCLAGLAVCIIRRKGSGRLVLPLWFFLSLAVIWIQAKFFLYHYLPLYLPCALLAGVAVSAAGRSLGAQAKGPEPSKQRAATLFVSLLLVIPILLDAGHLWRHWRATRSAAPVTDAGKDLSAYADGTDFSLAADLEVSDYLRRHTEPGDTLFIWGYETLVHFLADRPQASRFITHQPLASPWQMPGWREELLATLFRNPPARILVLRNDAMPALTGSTLDSAGLLGEFPGLEQFIAGRYYLETEIEDFMIFSPVEER